jgi:hypothetical protein
MWGPVIFHLFRPLKKHLAGMQFSADANMEQAVTSFPEVLVTNFLCWDASFVAMVG